MTMRWPIRATSAFNVERSQARERALEPQAEAVPPLKSKRSHTSERGSRLTKSKRLEHSLHAPLPNMRFTLCSILIAALLGGACAFPRFWPGRIDPDRSCYKHPQETQKGHDAPVTDSDIEFTLKKGRKARTTYCPGQKYVLTVKFGEPRRAMLTSTDGEFKKDEFVDVIPDCPTRKNLSGDPDNEYRNTDTYKVQWTAPCDKKAGKMTMFVTSATGATGGYLVNSATFPQGKECAAVKKCSKK